VINKVKIGVKTPFHVLKDGILAVGNLMYLLNGKIFKDKVLKETQEFEFVDHLAMLLCTKI